MKQEVMRRVCCICCICYFCYFFVSAERDGRRISKGRVCEGSGQRGRFNDGFFQQSVGMVDTASQCEKDIRGCFEADVKRVSIDFTEER